MQNVRMMLAGLLALLRGVTVQGSVASVTPDRFTWRMDIGVEVPPWLQISLDDKGPAPASSATPAPASELHQEARAAELHTEPPAPAPAPELHTELPPPAPELHQEARAAELHTEPPAPAPELHELLSEEPYFDGQMYFPR